ncbi:MAG: bifunctional UDP-N-acetylglucosamine diphosphorylase/glucosamine-1-phosphate N-acetyltransferase GlmU [Chloroflexi bacterium]|nr:bifunctional UDP-N-acetylglucosamine diphosphorylase/glucosamine-1-phosphate N-acetyltransferase GlmU [Chloroflexota bacterium]MCI0801988.1 bifunctional UDP-N-acetylglucosamine diphosphorylase/glucosamine-1-phosphate N-acetyltransferase GlmU [Chloroflexota bacterium]MCI0829018.1 bifunctional UDP-N-acetylglucosamine diphosphorylase/glucosamine-1-phosphate N-acetyltransferase GlmU [Chloroflexota bacterium]MCI0862685.1 bifunctional UDP-N-acetylglucosamine diphosphorylase/glucosamine-1-phosphate 
MDNLAGIILAAGEGTRMKSRTPKVLHRLCGKELIRYPVELFRRVGVDRVVVVVSPANLDAVKELLGDSVEYAVQSTMNGTAGAVESAAAMLRGQCQQVVVIGGDSPLVAEDSLRRLIDGHSENGRQMSILSGIVQNSQGLGRISRGQGSRQNVLGIIEAKDDAERHGQSVEVNSGVYCFQADWLWENLGQVKAGSGPERYLTDLAGIAAEQEASVAALPSNDPDEVLGVNNRVELARLEDVQRRRIRERWMLEGVTISDPSSVMIDAGVTIGQDTVVLPNTMLLGNTSIGSGCEIGPGSVLKDSTVGDDCRVTSSALEDAVMEAGVDIGPFSHLRQGAYLESGVHIGNYVEVKETRFAAGAVMGHFGYVGDASIGANVNMGAGTVTCNYDGKEKLRTVVEKDAFIGCDTMLVAPVTVGAGAVTGAGAVITKDVPPARLAVGVPAKIVDR